MAWTGLTDGKEAPAEREGVFDDRVGAVVSGRSACTGVSLLASLQPRPPVLWLRLDLICRCLSSSDAAIESGSESGCGRVAEHRLRARTGDTPVALRESFLAEPILWRLSLGIIPRDSVLWPMLMPLRMSPSMIAYCRVFVMYFVMAPALVCAQQPITLDDVDEGLPEIRGDEPFAAEFSVAKAAEYLDRSALNWQKTKKCATCHTNLFYMAARPALRSIQPDSGEVRDFYENYRKVRWQKKPPTEARGFWPIVVGTGLTLNDIQTSGELSDVARDVLDMVWTVQREDGGWNWPDCDYAPLEIDDHYGVTLVALTVGVAPDNYADTPQARAGLGKLRTYLTNNPPKSLHHRAMLAWSSVRVDAIVTEEQRKQTLAELLDQQLNDGGWSTAGLLHDWQGLVQEGQSLDTMTSDGYGTGFVIVVARELGVPADDPRLQRGINWLLGNQRKSGKWFTRSPVSECGNLISNVGSAYCILALQACGEIDGWPLEKSNPITRTE